MDLFSIIRMLHIIGGFTALLTFWVPVVTRKGGRIHKISGWVYVWGMIIVAISALYMGLYRLFDPESSSEVISFSIFLIYISILSGSTAYYGIRVLRFKGRKAVHKQVVDLGFPLLLLIFSGAVSVYGFLQNFQLLAWFPFLGIFLSGTQLKYWLRKPDRKLHWWFEHLGGMLGCSIATITAFTVFGAPRLMNIESVSILLWFLPTIILTPAIIGFSIYYDRKFNKKKVIAA
ncbi:DUF2306 domain-containing protein [Rossellomorea vietnamensis]|uniref:DUF2306 domain-containing protein n=1 Tax=Rossellomorea vietnamensis TaxID=218284 RepID=A0A5D4MED7_9BACI|nr:DUF2306 domain-containing protein [Rossellomorea vietnamensis]TYR99956.1 DUF2306 domain-containing protein [Rossellomorea vietnamensis]